MMLVKRLFLVLFCLSFIGCVSIPKIEGDTQAKLEKLEASGKEFQEIKNPYLAGALNVFLPGVGQMYAGDPGDGVLTLLTFWLAIPWYLGIVDAVQEARVQNAKYTIRYYENQGFKFSLLNSPDAIQPLASRYGLSIDESFKVY